MYHIRCWHRQIGCDEIQIYHFSKMESILPKNWSKSCEITKSGWDQIIVKAQSEILSVYVLGRMCSWFGDPLNLSKLF